VLAPPCPLPLFPVLIGLWAPFYMVLPFYAFVDLSDPKNYYLSMAQSYYMTPGTVGRSRAAEDAIGLAIAALSSRGAEGTAGGRGGRGMSKRSGPGGIRLGIRSCFLKGACEGCPPSASAKAAHRRWHGSCMPHQVMQICDK
jgi:hypothetical protein